MRIGELSRRTGISERSLRYYEEQGLLRPTRRPSGYRDYDEADVHTLRRIRTMLAAGLNTATIAEVLPCLVDDRDSQAQMCPELLAGLHRERGRIDGAIAELLATRAMLDTIIAAPQGLRSPPPAGRQSSAGRRRRFVTAPDVPA